MQFHEIRPHTKRRYAKRVGRGGKRGKTAGRGTKGQKARAGHKIRPAIRDFLKKLPKRRGLGKHTFRSFREKPVVVSIALLEKHFSDQEVITPASLLAKGLIHTMKGRMPAVKILGSSAPKKKFTLSGFFISRQAKFQIEEAGGTVSPVTTRTARFAREARREGQSLR